MGRRCSQDTSTREIWLKEEITEDGIFDATVTRRMGSRCCWAVPVPVCPGPPRQHRLAILKRNVNWARYAHNGPQHKTTNEVAPLDPTTFQ